MKRGQLVHAAYLPRRVRLTLLTDLGRVSLGHDRKVRAQGTSIQNFFVKRPVEFGTKDNVVFDTCRQNEGVLVRVSRASSVLLLRPRQAASLTWLKYAMSPRTVTDPSVRLISPTKCTPAD
jgi:hypothetical protein